MGEIQGQGYVGRAPGVTDVLAAAYFHALHRRPQDLEWKGHDRLLLTARYYDIALFAVLLEADILPEDKLEGYRAHKRTLPGHFRSP